MARTRTTISIEIMGDRALSRSLWLKAMRADELRPYFAAVTKDFRRMMVRQFDSEGTYLNGRKWAALSESREQQKQRQGLDPRILHATRRMRNSFTQGREFSREIAFSSLVLRTRVPYAGIHQAGYVGATHQLPKRQIVKINRTHSKRWAKGLQLYLKTGIPEVPPA